MMNWVKRIVPFALTFALGLFIASFFVSLSTPKFGKFERRQSYKGYCNMESKRMRMEREAQRRHEKAMREAFEVDGQKIEKPVFAPPLEPVVPRGYEEGGAIRR
jgi:hypothetical protein